jgi:hypothetical protein
LTAKDLAALLRCVEEWASTASVAGAPTLWFLLAESQIPYRSWVTALYTTIKAQDKVRAPA